MSNDIVERLRSLRHIHLPQLSDEAAAEIERLRFALAAYTSGISTGVDSKPTLSDAERSAIADAADRYAEITPESAETAATLRGLISRTGQNLRQTRDKAAECHSQNAKTPERERLTAAEREAIAYFAAFHRSPREADANAAATLRGLLERLK